MKYTLVIGIISCIFLYTSAQLPEGRRRITIPSLTEILTGNNGLETGVVDLSPSSGVFGDLEGGLNDGFTSPVGETGRGVPPVNGFGGAPDGFGAPSDGTTSADGFVHGGSAIESAGHDHAHGSEVHNNEAATVDQTNSITDARGNVPPPPTGVHVDLPGEHGNPHDFPVIHHGESPIQVTSDASTSVIHHSSNDFHPNSLAAMQNNLPGQDNSVPIPLESSHGPHTVTHGPANIDQSNNPFHATNVHNIAGRPMSKGGNFEDLTLSQTSGDGFVDIDVQQAEFTVAGLLDSPIKSPIPTTNHESDEHLAMHNMDNSASKTDGFLSQSDGFLTPLNEGHNDLPGQLHTPIDGVPVAQIVNTIPLGNTHIDLPGQHGVPLHGEPVVHREDNMNPIQGGPVANVHVDMPGEHNNPIGGEPVIHREIHHGESSHPVALDGSIPEHVLAGQNPSMISIPKAHQEIGVVPTMVGNDNQHINLDGIHIDAPGVHGNMLNEPALHLPPGATIQDAIAAGVIPDPSLPAAVELDIPGEHANPIDNHAVIHKDSNGGLGQQHDKPIKNAEIGVKVDSVHVDMPGQHNNPLDGTPVIHREGPLHNSDGSTGIVPSASELFSGSSIFGPQPIGNVHVDLPGEHGNVGEHPVIHRDETHIGSQVGVPTGNIHVDLPGEHGNNGQHPVIHRDETHIGSQVGVPTGNVHVDLPGEHGNVGEHPVIHRDETRVGPPVGVPMGNIRVDLPGEHGNNGLHPVIHRDETHVRPPVGVPMGNVHVDLPGEHGNLGVQSVVHRDATHIGPQVGVPTGNVHVDLPGVHGNIGEHPVIHRDETHIGSQVGVPIGNIHVDLPGVHGNLGVQPVVHRDATHIGSQISVPMGNVHVDLPGEHGNLGVQPVIHRDATHIGPQVGVPMGNVHIDLPGQHGNPTDGHPVIHREATHIGPQADIPIGNVHVDLPGQHGIPANGLPTLHKDPTPFGSQVDVPIGNIHIDLAGQHGIPTNGMPTIHRETIKGPQVGMPIGNVHVDMPGQHGNPIGNIPTIHRETTHIGPNINAMPGFHGKPVHKETIIPAAGLGKPKYPSHSGIHIDAPGEHGNQLKEPALHLPPGATIEDAHAAGVIPGPMDFSPKGIPKGIAPIVPTGVFPGTKNVPVPKPGGFVFKDHETIAKPHIPGSRKGKKFGDMLGLPSVHLKKAIGINDYDRTNFGIVDDDSIILKKGGRRRGGRRRKGRKLHKPTNSAPKKAKGESGITVIRNTRPNPLAILGNALKSVLSSRSSKGGGLLGSLIRSAIGAQRGPRILPPGGIIMRPVRRPLYGGLLIGK